MSIEVKAWRCEKCGKAWLRKKLADNCCTEKPDNECKVCGCSIKYPLTICNDCREKERYEQASKVKYSDYKVGQLWDERTNEYYLDKEDLKEAYDYINCCDEESKEPKYPTWCYGCDAIPFQIDIDDAIERASVETYEDFNEADIVDLDGLRKYIEEWNKKQTAITYYLDYNTVVLLNE